MYEPIFERDIETVGDLAAFMEQCRDYDDGSGTRDRPIAIYLDGDRRFAFGDGRPVRFSKTAFSGNLFLSVSERLGDAEFTPSRLIGELQASGAEAGGRLTVMLFPDDEVEGRKIAPPARWSMFATVNGYTHIDLLTDAGALSAPPQAAAEPEPAPGAGDAQDGPGQAGIPAQVAQAPAGTEPPAQVGPAVYGAGMAEPSPDAYQPGFSGYGYDFAPQIEVAPVSYAAAASVSAEFDHAAPQPGGSTAFIYKLSGDCARIAVLMGENADRMFEYQGRIGSDTGNIAASAVPALLGRGGQVAGIAHAYGTKVVIRFIDEHTLALIPLDGRRETAEILLYLLLPAQERAAAPFPGA